MADVSIIIINYNTCSITNECIKSIVEHTEGISYEIILVDNCSTDNSRSFFENDQRVRYIYSFENMGFGRANNVGMMLAKGNYIMLLNSDTILKNNAILMFYNYAKTLQQPAFLGCWLEDPNGNLSFSGRKEIQDIKNLLAQKWWFNRDADKLFYSEENCTRAGVISGAAMFFHREIYEKQLGFDHRFFMYYEEADWQRSCSRKGIYSYIIKGPRIIHLEGGSQNRTKGVRNVASFKRMYVSRCKYVKKDVSLLKYMLFRVADVILTIPQICFGKTANIQSIIPMLKILFRGSHG